MIKKIALIQPIVNVGKALRIQKAPTGIQFISAYLKSNGYQARMFHEEVNEELISNIAFYTPDMVGISSFSCSFPAAKEIANELKRINKTIPIVLGGWHASGCAESYLNGYEDWSIREILYKDSPFDFIISGEGEEAIVQLIQMLSSSSREEELKTISGIGFYDKSGALQINKGRRIADIEQLPDPDWEGLEINKYRDKRNENILDLSLHVQRGCRYHCAFCQTPNIYDGKSTRFSAERVADYIESLISRFSPNILTFTDEDFMADYEWLDNLSELLIKRGISQKMKFDSFGSIHDIILLNEKGILKKLRSAGWQNYFVGIESLNSPTLKTYSRPISNHLKNNIDLYLEKIQRAIDVSNENSIKLYGDYIVGYFEETQEEMQSGFDNLKKLKGMLYVYLPIFTPLPGTPLWGKANLSNVLIKKDSSIDWSLFDCSHQVINMPMNLVQLRDQFEREYFTTRNFINSMKGHIKQEPQKLDEWYIPLFVKLKKDHNQNSCFDFVLDELSELRLHKE